MTMQVLMSLVVVGVILGTIYAGGRLWQVSAFCQMQARLHARQEREYRKKSLSCNEEGEIDRSKGEFYVKKIEYHSRARAKYEHIATHPWETIPPDPPMPRASTRRTLTVPSPDTRELLNGSEFSLNEAASRSDIIETAELVSYGVACNAGECRCITGVVLKPSVVFMGAEGSREQTSLFLCGRCTEAIPHRGEEYIVFIKGMAIIKLLRKTEENVRSVEELMLRL
jgi:hypothetical protein